MRSVQRLLQGVVLVTLALGATRAVAAIPQNGVYTACYLKALSTLRLIDAADPKQKCLDKFETMITWSQVGPQGVQGPIGPVGPQGQKGNTGDMGLTGLMGPQGLPGAQGVQGLKGDKGDTGATGAKGDQGTPGINGTNGAVGPIGPRGPKGDTGSAGPSVPICLGRPGGSCSGTSTMACAYDKDCPSGETCGWSAGACSTSAQPCLSDAGCPSGQTCSNPRFVDNGNGAVTDRRTCLMWEKKTGTVGPTWGICPDGPECSDPHSVNNVYPYSLEVSPFTDMNGPVATLFLAQTNTAAFAGRTDWRLPTSAGLNPCTQGPCATGNDPEIESIILQPCTVAPCIDGIFGPTQSYCPYWTSSSYPAQTFQAYYGIFMPPVFLGNDNKPHAACARAVRGGPGVP